MPQILDVWRVQMAQILAVKHFRMAQRILALASSLVWLLRLLRLPQGSSSLVLLPLLPLLHVGFPSSSAAY